MELSNILDALAQYKLRDDINVSILDGYTEEECLEQAYLWLERAVERQTPF